MILAMRNENANAIDDKMKSEAQLSSSLLRGSEGKRESVYFVHMKSIPARPDLIMLNGIH